MLTLLLERTLRDYTHYTKESIRSISMKEANDLEEKDQYVVLLSDEVKIKEDLVFDKNSCELNRICQLGWY